MPATPSNPDQKKQSLWQWIKTCQNRGSEKFRKWGIIRRKKGYSRRDYFLLRLNIFASKWWILFLAFATLIYILLTYYFPIKLLSLLLENATTIISFLLFTWKYLSSLEIKILLALAIISSAFFLFVLFLIPAIPRLFVKAIKRLVKIVSSAWFLLLLSLFFIIALYFPSIAGPILPNVIEKDSEKITILRWAVSGIFGFFLFAQRLDVMNRQADTAQRQHEAKQFKQASELLAHKKMVARMAGVTMLGALARTDPEKWHIVAVDVLAHFIRERSKTDEKSPVKTLIEWYEAKNTDSEEEKWQKFDKVKNRKAPYDIAKAMGVISKRLTKEQKAVVRKQLNNGYAWPELEGCWLNRVNLEGAWLPKATLQGSLFTKAILGGAWLPRVNFCDANLHLAKLDHTVLNQAGFDCANLTKTDFEKAKGLENRQFNSSLCFDVCTLEYPVTPEESNTKPRNLPAHIEQSDEAWRKKEKPEKDYWKELAEFWHSDESGQI